MSSPGAPFVWTPGAAFPSVPSGQIGTVVISGTVSGVASLPVPYNIVLDSATVPVTILANGTTPQVASITGWDQTYDANGGGGYFVSGNIGALGAATPGGAGTAAGAGTAHGNLWAIGASGGGSSFLFSDDRSDSIVATQGTNWIATGANSHDRIWVTAGTAVIASSGADTIAIGAADATLMSTGDALVFGGTGSLFDLATSGMATLVGDKAAVTAAASGSASLLAYGGSDGHNALLGAGAAATLVGGGNGDVLSGLAGSNILVAGSGNETLFGGASAQTSFVGGSGTDVMVGLASGSAFYAGTGTDQVIAGGNSNQFNFVMGKAGGSMVVMGFNGTDTIDLVGYGPNAASTAFNSAQMAGGSTMITLADNTKITLLGFTDLAPHNIV